MGVDLGAVSRFKTAAVAVITGCCLASCGSGWVRGWVLGTWAGKSLLCFLVEIHLSWLCQPPTFSNLEQWQKKHTEIYASVGCDMVTGQRKPRLHTLGWYAGWRSVPLSWTYGCRFTVESNFWGLNCLCPLLFRSDWHRSLSVGNHQLDSE